MTDASRLRNLSTPQVEVRKHCPQQWPVRRERRTRHDAWATNPGGLTDGGKRALAPQVLEESCPGRPHSASLAAWRSRESSRRSCTLKERDAGMMGNHASKRRTACASRPCGGRAPRNSGWYGHRVLATLSGSWSQYSPSKLEEERHAGRSTGVSKLRYPIQFHRPSVGTGLTTSNDPVNACEIQLAERAEQRLGAHEFHGGGSLAKVIHAERVATRLNAHAHPKVRRPVQLICNSAQSLRSLGEHLVGVLRRLSDDIEDLRDELDGHVLMEEVAHRVHEDETGSVPTLRHIKGRGMEGEPEARAARPGVAVVLVLDRAHRLEPLGQSERVAVVAARRGTVAARGRVPRRLSPLDR